MRAAGFCKPVLSTCIKVILVAEVQAVVIPTLSKTKISHTLSYPIGARDVSIALRSAGQLPELKLHFYSGFDIGLRSGHYEFLRVEYLNNATSAEEWPVARLYRRPPQYQWEIIVQPVPRVFRHRIKQYIRNSALPKIAHWLAERAQLAQQGSDMLAFFYDEKVEDFTVRPLTRLEPARAK